MVGIFIRSASIVAMAIAAAFAWAALTGTPPAVSSVSVTVAPALPQHLAGSSADASRLHVLMGAIVRDESFSIDGRTYIALPAGCALQWGHGPGRHTHWGIMCATPRRAHFTRSSGS